MLTDNELSALVAEKVMGFHLLKNDRTRMVRELNAKGTAAGMYVERVLPFATDAGLALEAAMKADGERYRIHLFGVGSRHVCSVGERFGVFGSTPARALCLAALRASGVAVTDDD